MTTPGNSSVFLGRIRTALARRHETEKPPPGSASVGAYYEDLAARCALALDRAGGRFVNIRSGTMLQAHLRGDYQLWDTSRGSVGCFNS
jgi:hypothetical protein